MSYITYPTKPGDHSLLRHLEVDTHTQYLPLSGVRPMTGVLSCIPSGLIVGSARFYTAADRLGLGYAMPFSSFLNVGSTGDVGGITVSTPSLVSSVAVQIQVPAGSKSLGVTLPGEGNSRAMLFPHQVGFGPGTGARDTFMERTGASALRLRSGADTGFPGWLNLTVAGSIQSSGLDVSGYSIQNVADPIADRDAVNYSYLYNNYLALTGGTIIGAVEIDQAFSVVPALSIFPYPGNHYQSSAYSAMRWFNADGEIAAWMAPTGTLFASGIDARGNRVTNVGTPILGTDAVNKAYADSLTFSGTGGGTTIIGSGGAPVDAQYVVLATNTTLTEERVLTGTSNQVVVTDNGAGSTVVLSTPQDIHTGAAPTFAGLTANGPVSIVSADSGYTALALTQTSYGTGANLLEIARATDERVIFTIDSKGNTSVGSWGGERTGTIFTGDVDFGYYPSDSVGFSAKVTSQIVPTLTNRADPLEEYRNLGKLDLPTYYYPWGTLYIERFTTIVGASGNTLVGAYTVYTTPGTGLYQAWQYSNVGHLPLRGGTMSGSISMGGFKLSNLTAPVNATDAVTKAYADGLVTGGVTLGGDVTGTTDNNVIAAGAVTNTKFSSVGGNALAWTKVSKSGSVLKDIGNVSTTDPSVDGQVLTWSASLSKWYPAAPTGGASGSGSSLMLIVRKVGTPLILASDTSQSYSPVTGYMETTTSESEYQQYSTVVYPGDWSITGMTACVKMVQNATIYIRVRSSMTDTGALYKYTASLALPSATIVTMALDTGGTIPAVIAAGDAVYYEIYSSYGHTPTLYWVEITGTTTTVSADTGTGGGYAPLGSQVFG